MQIRLQFEVVDENGRVDEEIMEKTGLHYIPQARYISITKAPLLSFLSHLMARELSAPQGVAKDTIEVPNAVGEHELVRFSCSCSYPSASSPSYIFWFPMYTLVMRRCRCGRWKGRACAPLCRFASFQENRTSSP